MTRRGRSGSLILVIQAPSPTTCLPTGSSAMKQPRVTDFDPNAKVPKLSSPMDKLPPIEKPKKPQPIAIQPPSAPLPEPSVQRDVNQSRRRDVTTSASRDVNKSIRHDVSGFDINRKGVSH